MAVAGKHICPQCFYENPLHVEHCQLCGWNMAQEPDDATRFVPQPDERDQTESVTRLAPKPQMGGNSEGGPEDTLDDSAATRSHTHTFNLTGNLAHLEVNQIIGKGGMGAIYRATDHTLERQVAIKALKANQYLDQAGRDLLLEEARTICKLNHPNIVTVYDVAKGDDNHFIIMEWIDGDPLDKLIPAHGYDLPTALNYAQQIVEGLLSAHQQHIIHSDIKPQNIMLSQDGSIKILDFGIAQLSQEHVNKPINQATQNLNSNQKQNQAQAQVQAKETEKDKERETESQTPLPNLAQVELSRPLPQVNGTAGYMSPEQVLGASQLDERSDIFAFGIVFYQLLTGKPPFSGKNGKQKNAAVITGDYPALPATVPEDVRAIVHHCLQQSPAQRYQSTQALANDLHAYLTGEPVSVIHHKSYWLKKKTLKHKWPVLLCVLAMLTGSGFLVWQQLEAANQAFREQLLTRFISRVETLEANVQMSKMAPTHDTTAETALWHQQIQAIKDESEALGEQATGAAGYAIGRMYYALQNYDQALHYLQQAWNSGFTESRVAYNLALTHGAIYQRQKALIANLSSNSAKRDRTAKLDQAHKQPAIDYLNQGLQGSPYYSYTQALLQYYQGDYASALQTLNNAQDLPTWFYDHITLQGDIYLAQAEAKGGAHGDEEVKKNAQRAIQHYAKAAELGRSDLQLQLKPLDVYFRLLNNDLYGEGKNFNALYQQTQPHLDKAHTIAPQDYRPYLVKGQMALILSDFEDQYTGEPIETVKQAVNQLTKANKLSPDNPDILFILASAKRQLIYLKLNRQEAVKEEVIEVSSLFAQIPETNRDYYYYNILGLLYKNLAEHYQQQFKLQSLNWQTVKEAEDRAQSSSAQNTLALAEDFLLNADLAFSQATNLQPNRVGALINRASLHRLWAVYQTPAHAKASLTQAIAIYQQARQLNPDHFVVNYYLAVSYQSLAQINNQLHQSNVRELKEINEYRAVANQAQPNHPFVFGLYAHDKADRVIYAWQEGRGYSASLNSSIMALEEQIGNTSEQTKFVVFLAYIQVIKGQIDYFEGRLKRQFIQDALVNSQKASVDRGNPEYILLQLLAGNWQQISQKNIDELKTLDIEILARAEWYSQAGQFKQADYYFKQIQQYYPSLLWLYRHQHLHRWLKAIEVELGDTNQDEAPNDTKNPLQGRPEDDANLAQVARIKVKKIAAEIAKLEEQLKQHYPNLTIPQYP